MRSAGSGTTQERGKHTKQQFGLIGVTQWDPRTGYTYVGVSVSAPRIFSNPSPEWDKYLGECGESLHRVAARESVEVQGWSTDLAFEDGLTRITHHVHALGELTGGAPNLLQWALAPTPDYETLHILARALREGVLVDSHLKWAAEANCLRRDRAGKRLPDPIPAQLLALALAEPGWRGLVSPGDNPWAYVNTVTRRIYERNYAEGTGSANPLEIANLLPWQIDKRVPSVTGDELVIENLPDLVLHSGCSADVICVLTARHGGKKWSELPKYLAGLTGTHWDRRRVEAASEWKTPLNKATSYKERLRKGEPWNGLSTYSHSLQGANVDIYREVMAAERKELFVTK
jgi:hypothetical protein